MAKIEVTTFNTLNQSVTEVLTRAKFDKKFGKAEGKEILAGYLPHIVAVEI
jgi:hypothetical protein